MAFLLFLRDFWGFTENFIRLPIPFPTAIAQH